MGYAMSRDGEFGTTPPGRPALTDRTRVCQECDLARLAAVVAPPRGEDPDDARSRGDIAGVAVQGSAFEVE